MKLYSGNRFTFIHLKLFFEINITHRTQYPVEKVQVCNQRWYNTTIKFK